MSGAADELNKLQEKSQTLFSSVSSSAATASRVEVGQVIVHPHERSSTGLLQAFVTRVMPVISPQLLCSEDSVSMLVHCFSP